MLEAERHRIIVKLVEERSVASIADLVETLGASAATVRRDINALAELGKLRRIHGGAESLTPRHESHIAGTPFVLSQTMRAAQKRAIARAAAALIDDGDSIIINGGTTTYALVEFLKQPSLDILTNSLPIITKLLANTKHRVAIPGGKVYREQNIVLSPYDTDTIEHFWGNKLLTGCHGINRFGMMETDPLVVQAETKLLKRADEVIVLADSRKLKQRSPMVVAPLDRISTIVTDDSAKDADLKPFREAGITVIKAKVTAEDEELAKRAQVAA